MTIVMTGHDRFIARRRAEYGRAGLSEQEAGDDPLALFDRWFRDAVAACEASDDPVYEPNVMTLATADADGVPAARIVLLKHYDADGFVFFTNYESAKGREVEANPRASLVFYWMRLERQVRVAGVIEKVSRELSERYFADRPRGSQLSAWVSRQSEPVSRAELERRLAELEEDYEGREVPCPPHWGGYCVRPQRIEFWQGRPSRLHDRILFERGAEGGWCRSRLAP